MDNRVICSSITLRKLPLRQALTEIREQGFEAIDLGALPGVCDHVPYELDHDAVREVAATVAASGLAVASINGDIGDLNAVLNVSEREARTTHLDRLLNLCEEVGSPALVLPCGNLGHDPIRSREEDVRTVADELRRVQDSASARGLAIWCESLHSGRLCFDMEHSRPLVEALRGSGVGHILDFSHIVASGDDPLDFIREWGAEVTHVHVRDAVRGNIHLSVGNGNVDFKAGIAALGEIGYTGKYSLELETRDVDDDDRPRAARAAGEYISALLN